MVNFGKRLISSFQSQNRVWLFVTPWAVICQVPLSFRVTQNLLKFMSVESMMLSSHLILCYYSSCLQSFPAAGSFPMSQLFTSGGQSIRAPASASALPKNTQCWFPLGLTFDILAVQGTCKNLLQHHSLKVSVLRHSAFFMVQLSHTWLLEKP